MKTSVVTRVKIRPILSTVGVPTVVTVLLYLARLGDVTFVQLVLSYVLLVIPWKSYLNWRRSGQYLLPIFSIISGLYWLYYAVPLFLEDRVFSTTREPIGHELADGNISAALFLALLGACFLWLGLHSGVSKVVNPKRTFVLEPNSNNLNYVRLVLVVGSLLTLSEMPLLIAGEGGRQLVGLIVSVIPVLAFAILFRNFIRRQSNVIDRLLVLMFLVLRLMGGLSAGWLGVSASILVICGAIYLIEFRRVPRWALVAVVLFTVFFQVGKEDFRKEYWQSAQPVSRDQDGRVERVSFWVQNSFDKWAETLNDSSGEAWRRALNPSVTRISLLNQTANVIELTPSVVPYQYGWLYSYLVITLIPRFVWPDKPSMNEANQYYQVAYGLTSDDELAKVSISVGFLTESYINFGWLGVAAVMFLVGIFFDLYQRMFLARTSGVLMTEIGRAHV